MNDTNIFDNNSANETAGLVVFGEGTITQNFFQNNQGDQAVFLFNFHGTFMGNTLVGNNTNKGLYVLNGNSPFPSFFNNIIARSGNNAMSIQGVISSYVEFEHNTLVGKGIGAAIHIPTTAHSVNLSLTNNIISGFPTGVDNNDFPNSKVNGEHTLFDLDVTEPGVNATFLNSLAGDPSFKNPTSGDYHIRYTSPAKDAGISIINTTQDIDGDPRIIGSAPDIGADEYRPALLYMPLIKK